MSEREPRWDGFDLKTLRDALRVAGISAPVSDEELYFSWPEYAQKIIRHTAHPSGGLVFPEGRDVGYGEGAWGANKKFQVGPRSFADDQSFGMVIPVADVFGDDRETHARVIVLAVNKYLAGSDNG